MISFVRRRAVACAIVATTFAGSAVAESQVGGLANAICGAKDMDAITSALNTYSPEEPLQPEMIAEAFGVATFLADLGRCTNRQAIADSFAVFKKGKDAVALDTAFATGRVAAKPEGAGASAAVFQGSFAQLGTAGDPPSGQ
jgi:hypothetical protein